MNTVRESDVTALQMLEEEETPDSESWPPPTAGSCCSTF
ncbi:ALQxL family class IV lanthipeptide [Streptomyces sp. TLI_146]|nr:ALQxL family class IV lanthipeptide [Streptomyces sp. TLI_146]